ncbi:hypothetical protein M404DRAFT_121641 [Pisolithus tinctorius Marx 270]|uniref:Uncharacterized protein n=1 Tax=Pisolithus tinctorius Marx 270 TaxID=870435 RepID=A0A0C3KWW4_PISTI|nr:hypothetical protein M404DRAFT_121641 [Pisolithus tinctorius Marx 270]
MRCTGTTYEHPPPFHHTLGDLATHPFLSYHPHFPTQITGRYNARLSNQTSSRAYPQSKWQQSPTGAPGDPYKKFRPFQSSTNQPDFGPLPVCAVCLSHECHNIPVVECCAPHTWDNKHETFSKRVHRVLYSRKGVYLCPRWQCEEGCSE